MEIRAMKPIVVPVDDRNTIETLQIKTRKRSNGYEVVYGLYFGNNDEGYERIAPVMKLNMN
jgi:hypothetical protein